MHADAPREEAAADTIREALLAAIGLHQSGRVDEAAAAYFAILQTDRNNPDALHYLGLAVHQQGRSLLGINLIRRAIGISPDYIDALNNLANIYQETGGTASAVAAYKAALELRPDHTDAARNLAIALRKLERLEQSAAKDRAAIEREPDNVQHLYDLASTYHH